MMSRYFPRVQFLIQRFWLIPFLLWGSLVFGQNAPETGSASDISGPRVIVDDLAIALITSPAAPGEADPATYKLGPTDIISFETRGAAAFTFRAGAINSSGDLVVPSLGAIRLSGLTLNDAKAKLDSVVSGKFINSGLKYLTLDRARPIQVALSGPGIIGNSLPLPGLTRLTVPLGFALNPPERAGQPTRNLSIDSLLLLRLDLRKIAIKKADGTTRNADLLAHLLTGEQSGNPILEDGDQVQIHQQYNSDPRISIGGGVRLPFEASFLPDDTVEKLVAMAGGFQETAETSYVLIYRGGATNADPIRVEKNADGTFNFELRANDRIQVPLMPETSDSYSAWILGEVGAPGIYPVTDGTTTLGELLQTAGGLRNTALPKGAFIIRQPRSFPNINVPFQDTLLVGRTSDQFLEGFQYLSDESQVSLNKTHVDVSDADELAATPLFDGDRVFIPRDDRSVLVFGQVNKPGHFPFIASRTVNEYLEKAGGFALAADRTRIFIIKAGTRAWLRPEQTELESGDYIYVDRKPYENYANVQTRAIQERQVKTQRLGLLISAISAATTFFLVFRR